MTPLLMLPGLLCDRALFEPLMPALADRARCMVADYASESRIASMARRALDAAPARFALAGHSMGGRVALEVYRAAPERVERIALLDTGYLARAADEAGEREIAQRMALLDLARREGVRAMAEQWVRIPMVHPERLGDIALIDAIVGMMARRTLEQFAAQIAALLGRPDGSAVLARIDCPALVLCGRDDAWAPLAQHDAMHRRIRGSRLVAIDGCGHMAPMERPDAVAAAMLDWLAQPPAPHGETR